MKQAFHLDDLSRRILRVLQADATLSQTELAERVGSSAASCWRRVRALEAAGVLGRTVRRVDRNQVGCPVDVICQVRLKSHEDQLGAAFERFVRQQPNILDCYSMSGDWDYLLRVVAADIADYERFLMRVLLRHEAVATASSHFALSCVKSETALPV
jgi:DNA-binding Lrp family transcriptional regulator